MKIHFVKVLSLCFFSLFFTKTFSQNVDSTTPGTYSSTVPLDAVSATVEIWGAGGSGGGSKKTGRGGGGGGGGAYATQTFTVTAGETITYEIGAGGAIATNSGSGNTGGESTLNHTISGTSITVGGGEGGTQSNSFDNAGGAGGTATGGATNIPGSPGGSNGFGIGGQGGDSGNTINTGGNGGILTHGSPGHIPGGGGGGAFHSGLGLGNSSFRDGGAGANGKVIITYEIILRPVINNFSPSAVCVGETVTLTGRNFTNATSVKFNGTEALSFTVNSDTEITAVTPNTSTGLITVTTPIGTTNSANPISIYAIPEISISANYCPVDLPSTSQNESNMVQLTATSNQNITSWLWSTGETSSTIYISQSGAYNVTATTSHGCTNSTLYNMSQDLIINGDFNLGNAHFVSDYLYIEDQNNTNNELQNDQDNRGYSITQNGQNVHNSFWGYDHTGDSQGYFMAVNGKGTSLIVWAQNDVTVEPNTEYYFSAWAMSLNSHGPYAQLTFNINGTNIGTSPVLAPHPNNNNLNADNWTQFYGTYTTGPSETVVDIEIRNLQSALAGNDFGLDDISFMSKLPFLHLTSAPETQHQTLCENAAIETISVYVGDGLSTPTVTGLPSGLSTNYNGTTFTISGTPTETGVFNYTITSNLSCGQKTLSGTLNINPIPTATLSTASPIICASEDAINLEAILGGTATSGTWSISGTPLATTVTGNSAMATYLISSSGTKTFTFTSNTPNGPCNAVTETLDIEIIPYNVAHAGPDQTALSCENTTITLAANNEVSGFWSATPQTGYFSDPTSPNSQFTGESGTTYQLTWNAINTASVCDNDTDSLTFTIPNCGSNLIFAGNEEYIDFGDHYNLLQNFSIELWLKPNTQSNSKQTILSKRNAEQLNTGYDLSLTNGTISFNANNNTSISVGNISTARWYHIAITYNGSYTMYLDGIEKATLSGSAPLLNDYDMLIGAMAREDNMPTHHLDAWLDEIRIWNTALSTEQIRIMMNQEIENNNGVIGSITGPEVTTGLLWNNLEGYYKMNQGTTDITNGFLNANTGASGQLNNMSALQSAKAPLPYVTETNGSWDVANTWQGGTHLMAPNTNDVYWNIVKTTHNVTIDRPMELLGLIVDTNHTLTVSNNQPLVVRKYLKIDGTLDLVGESQLIQHEGSIVDTNGTGILERDQQGTSNKFNYNYWGSPVSNAAGTYQLSSILFDGNTPLNWTTNYNGSPSPLTISSRWLYVFNDAESDYSNWSSISQNTAVAIGLGYTMKGSGSSEDSQNYTFKGQPNNGEINLSLGGGFNYTLLGNPYPSALDADQFIADNENVLDDGTITFWEQAPSNNSHMLADYEGRYSYYNYTGGAPAVTAPSEIYGAGNASKIPERYIPIGQGFFVSGNETGGLITFNNNQRCFKTEASGASLFFRPSNGTLNTEDLNQTNSEESVIRRIYFNFTTPEGAVRQLLLGFTSDNAATDGVDYGYDALNADTFPSDLSFNIEGERYIIQGVGEFEATKVYPLDMILGLSGNVEISLHTLENFETPIDVYIYDALLETYTRFNTVSYQQYLEAGTYTDQFYLAFQDQETLGISDATFNAVTIRYLNQSKAIFVQAPLEDSIKTIQLVNIAGQTLATWTNPTSNSLNQVRIPVKHIAQGTHILKVETKNKTIHKKIIVTTH